MKLDEAIRHAKEVADKKRKRLVIFITPKIMKSQGNVYGVPKNIGSLQNG